MTLSVTDFVQDTNAWMLKLPVGMPFDFIYGQYEETINGHMTLNGGVPNTVAVTGNGNIFKTTLLVHFISRILHRLESTQAYDYDSECSSDIQRIGHLYETSTYEEFNPERFFYTDASEMLGDEFFANIRKYLEARVDKGQKDFMMKTPFIDEEGNQREVIHPFMAAIDSLTEFTIDDADAIMSEHMVGNSKTNRLAMLESKAKGDLISRLPRLCKKFGAYFMLTAHTGKVINMDPMKPLKKDLTHMAVDEDFKRTSRNFKTLINLIIKSETSGPLKTKDGGAKYPADERQDEKGEIDLIRVVYKTIRTKMTQAGSGALLELIFSQNDGFLPEITALEFLKAAKGFGLGGNDTNYFLQLYPDVKMNRKTVRRLVKEDAKLRRAFELTFEYAMMKRYWDAHKNEHLVPLDELYEGIKKQGYDWDTILATKGGWDASGPGLSALDILRMNKGLFKPKL